MFKLFNENQIFEMDMISCKMICVICIYRRSVGLIVNQDRLFVADMFPIFVLERLTGNNEQKLMLEGKVDLFF